MKIILKLVKIFLFSGKWKLFFIMFKSKKCIFLNDVINIHNILHPRYNNNKYCEIARKSCSLSKEKL